MKNIKTLKRGNLTLIHNRYRDDFGILRDILQIDVLKEGRTTTYPFIAPMKATNYSPNQPYNNATQDYTDEEYAQMLDTNFVLE